MFECINRVLAHRFLILFTSSIIRSAQRFFENPFSGWSTPSPQKMSLTQANAALPAPSPLAPQSTSSARSVSVWAMLDQAKVELDTAQRELLAARRERASKARPLSYHQSENAPSGSVDGSGVFSQADVCVFTAFASDQRNWTPVADREPDRNPFCQQTQESEMRDLAIKRESEMQVRAVGFPAWSLLCRRARRL